MNSFKLEIVTPTKIQDEGQVEHIRCPGLDGYFGVMANHREAIIGLGVGEIKVTQNGKDYFLATSGGFAEIIKERVGLLLETYEQAGEIDAARAEVALKRAQERKDAKDAKDVDVTRNDTSLLRAANRLKVSKR
ncbi:MAG: ATP synthase F1 subunit epsilon [Candidatus Marinimicrobia bacterium]|jgi:F-type H+-transporting ATPase subunit epsilon|nr:ATP synthase F1 subunit epsilon [Candidatus Neomarinimicrobiota bacterium]MDP6611440.1 ATP synthase F1 subunit epsilon [Candidatus Neomarinimicrobiota bacterium]|tara:strand:- start:100 stop:501 length:402 start_codon:yes stop_codon:yes gene_type:complete